MSSKAYALSAVMMNREEEFETVSRLQSQKDIKIHTFNQVRAPISDIGPLKIVSAAGSMRLVQPALIDVKSRWCCRCALLSSGTILPRYLGGIIVYCVKAIAERNASWPSRGLLSD